MTGKAGLGQVMLQTVPGGAWTLAGKLSFDAKASGCNFAIHVAGKPNLASFDPACEKQTTCRIHNELVISDVAWNQIPEKWSGNLSTYRSELVSHLLGIWLGFEHASCSASATPPQPVLTAPTIVVPGCSPNWFAIAPESQDRNVLAGF